MAVRQWCTCSQGGSPDCVWVRCDQVVKGQGERCQFQVVLEVKYRYRYAMGWLHAALAERRPVAAGCCSWCGNAYGLMLAVPAGRFVGKRIIF